MGFGAHDDLVLLGLLVAAAALIAAAPGLRIPYPILLVLGGLGLGFVPGAPHIRLPPELVLVAFLPPLLYYAAYATSLRDLRRNVRPISLLAIGLVLATTIVVAVVAHATIDLSWASAFVLGAIVSPTDPVAATAIAQRLGVPRRIVTVIEGESLINDATALVAYRLAVVAVVSGTFSIWHAGLAFLGNVVGGVAVGLAVGLLVAAVRRRLDDPPVETTISLITGYLAYLPASALGASGVVAVVTAGVVLGWMTPRLTNAEQRLQSAGAWEILVFVLNSLLFVLVGLQLPSILDNLASQSGARLAYEGGLIAATVVVTRLVWIFPATYLPRWAVPRVRARDPYPPWQHPALIGWTGLRGAVSLAAALALPFTTHAGRPFPGRDLIVFLTFCVILGTLVVQGLSLPLVIRLLGLEDDGVEAREEAKARIRAAEAALARIEELVEEEWVRDDTAERLRRMYGFRRDRFRARFDGEDDGSLEERSTAFQRLRRELLEAERSAIVQLRRDGHINDDVMHRIERDLDLEDTRLDA